MYDLMNFENDLKFCAQNIIKIICFNKRYNF